MGNAKLYGKIDLSMLKFGTGSFYRRDEDDEDENGRGFGPDNHNNPIIWGNSWGSDLKAVMLILRLKNMIRII